MLDFGLLVPQLVLGRIRLDELHLLGALLDLYVLLYLLRSQRVRSQFADFPEARA